MKLLLLISLNILIGLPNCAYSDELVLTGVTLIDGTGNEPKSDVTIVVKDGRIMSIVDGPLSVTPQDATIIDAAGKFVIPGLSDMHVHFGSGGLVPDTDIERILQQFLFYGVTTIFNLGASNGRIADILKYRQLAESGKLTTPQIFATGGILTIPGSHPVSPMEVLISATRRPAEMVGHADGFGTIQVRMRADLLVLAENPLEDTRNTRTLEMEIQGGRVLDRLALVAD